MSKFTLAALAALLLMATSAYAQMADQAGQPGSMPENGYHQAEISVVGKITDFNLSRGTLTLDDGMQFTLAPSFEYTSFPAIGEQVEVIYDVEGGQKVAHSIDAGFEGHSHSSS